MRGVPGQSTGRIILPETLVRWQEEHCRSGRRARLLEPQAGSSASSFPLRKQCRAAALRPGALPRLRPERLGLRVGLHRLQPQRAWLSRELGAVGAEWGAGVPFGGARVGWGRHRRGEGSCISMLSGGGSLGALSTRPLPPRARGFPSPRCPPAYPSRRGGTELPPPPPTPAPQFRVCRLNQFHLSARHLRALRGCVPPPGARPPPHLLLRRSREPPPG